MQQNSELYSNLLNEILGFYDFMTEVKVFRHLHSSDAEVMFTEFHEESHRKIVSSTTFGTFQMILAFVANEASQSINLPWSSDAENILSETIKHSWFAHEGYAVFRELVYGNLCLPKQEPPTFPPDYEQALKKYKTVSEQLPVELKPFELELIRGIAEVAFNTPILDLISIRDIELSSVIRHFENPYNQPDFRLNCLIDAINKEGISRNYVDELIGRFHEITEEQGFGKIVSIPDFMREASVNLDCKKLNFFEKWDEIETPLTIAEFKRLKTDLEIIETNVALTKIYDYHKHSKSFLKDCGINLPERITGDFHEIAIYSGDTDYPPPPFFEEEVIFLTDLKTILPKLMETLEEEEECKLVLELSKVQNISLKHFFSGDYINTLYLTLLTPIKTSEDFDDLPNQLKAFEVFNTQFALVGEPDLINTLTKSLDKFIIQIPIDLTFINLETWEPIDEALALLQELNKRPLLVLQTTKSTILSSFIEQWIKVGIKEISLIWADGRLYYYHLVLNTELHIIFKIPDKLLGIFRVHRSDIWQFFQDSLLSRQNSKSILVELSLPETTIARLDMLGTFYHLSKS